MSEPQTKPEGPFAGCGAFILNSAGDLLLIQRLREPEAGAWGLPGGKIDFCEPAKVATVREIREELGIEIELKKLAGLTETIDAGDGKHWVAPVYESEIVSGEPEIQEPEKHGGCGWFAMDALPEYLTTPTRQILDQQSE